MTQQRMNMNGVVDLGAIAAAREAATKAQRGQGAATTNATHGLSIDVTVESFESDVALQSKNVPVILHFWSARSAVTLQLRTDLEKAAVVSDGAWLLCNVDVDTQMQIAQAFQIQSLPAVFALIDGKPLPLPITGADEPDHVANVIEAVLQQAAAMGVTGRVSATGPQVHETQPISDPRFDAAETAIDQGDWESAKAAYQEVLATTPSDTIARIGLLNVELMQRTDGVDFDVAIKNANALGQSPSDEAVQQHLLAADVEFMLNDVSSSFDRLLGLVRLYPGVIRDSAKLRLLDLFQIAGPENPEVRRARIDLSNALF